MILKTLLPVFLLMVASMAVNAQGRQAAGLDRASDYAPWRAVNVDMSPDEYRDAYRENRRFLRHVFRTQASAALVSLGVPETGIQVLGAAAALAFDQDAKLHLNRDHTVALEFSDMIDDKRAVNIGVTLRW